jgi:hypothetical protein
MILKRNYFLLNLLHFHGFQILLKVCFALRVQIFEVVVWLVLALAEPLVWVVVESFLALVVEQAVAFVELPV